MKKYIWTAALILLGAMTSGDCFGQFTIASEDFDGGATNLTSSMVPTMDGGNGDTFAVGATQAWPTTGGTPFSIADNSVGDVGDSTLFAGDTEGVYGVNSDFTNNFLGISDSDEFGDVIATWVFDISTGGGQLTFNMDMGSMEGSAFAYGDGTMRFDASIDGGATQVLFDINPDVAGDGYNYRALDDGVVVTADTNALSAFGDNTVTKLLAGGGGAAADTFLDKSLAATGELDTFTTDVNGTGSLLTLTLTANIPFEAIVFDNFEIVATEAVPEPTSAVVGLGLMGMFLLRRRK